MRTPRLFTPRARRVGEALLLGLLVSVAVTAASQLGALAGWETRAVDMFLFFRDRLPTPEIALVVIDDDSFEALGARQPLPRDYLADLADFLLRSGARVVAFDVVLKSASVPEEDTALLATARRWETAGKGRLVFATVATPETHARRPVYTASEPFTRELSGIFAFANAPVGADGMIRRAVGFSLPSGSRRSRGTRGTRPRISRAPCGGRAPRGSRCRSGRPAEGSREANP